MKIHLDPDRETGNNVRLPGSLRGAETPLTAAVVLLSGGEFIGNSNGKNGG